MQALARDSFSLWINAHYSKQSYWLCFYPACAGKDAQSQTGGTESHSWRSCSENDCVNQDDFSSCELFLVEGDSAGGSAKQARNKYFQAVMPLRGKILNTWEVAPEQVLASQEVHDIALAIGALAKVIYRDYVTVKTFWLMRIQMATILLRCYARSF